jgi:hypothetical protein
LCSLLTCGNSEKKSGPNAVKDTAAGDLKESSADKGDFSQPGPVSMFLIVPNIADCAHC